MNVGGKYKAAQNPDGTWNLFLVPVLAAHERELGFAVDGESQKFRVDEAWLEKALGRAVSRKTADAYLAPLHVNHHGRKEAVSRAGYFMPRRVGMIHYQGQELPCLFADFLNVKAEVYGKIKAGDLPYVSVEILDVTAEPEIDSCALMDHVVPYFKFPLLNVGEEIPATSIAAVSEAGPMTAYAHSGKRMSVLCYMAGAELPKPEEKPDDKTAEKPGEHDGDKKDDKKPEGGLMDKMMTMLSAIMQHLGLSKGSAGVPDPSPVDQGGKTMAAAKLADVLTVTTSAAPALTVTAVSQAMTYSKADLDSAVALAEAPLRAEIASLKVQVSKQVAEDGLKSKVAATLKKLAAYALGSDVEAELIGIAGKAGDKADDVLAAYASAIEKRGIKDPAPAFTADVTVSTDALPAEVIAYSSPEKVKKATEYWNSFKAMGRHVGQTTLKEFIANCMSADETFKPGKSSK